MRDDMAKVIVERPRLGRGLPFPRRRLGVDRRNPDDPPRREGMKRVWRGDTKSLNENLAPLRRYLHSNVGRPWDKVYSEIARHIRLDSAVQLHVLQHLEWEVLRDPLKVAWLLAGDYAWIRERFYVDPRTRLLRHYRARLNKHERYAARLPPPDPNAARIGGRAYRRLDGVWYAIEYALVPAEGRVWDAVQREFVWNGDGRRQYASSKRQLGKKEIRRLRLAT